jgi:hypothetical protein
MRPAQGSPSYSSVVLISSQTPIGLGAETPVVHFGEESKRPGTWAGRRLMFLAATETAPIPRMPTAGSRRSQRCGDNLPIELADNTTSKFLK